MSRLAPRVLIGAGSIERAAATARSSTLFASRLAAFKQANANFLGACAAKPPSPDELTDALCEQAGDAYRDVIMTPAGDLLALAAKIEVAAAWNDDVSPKQDAIDAIYADVRALLNEGPQA
jgi:hypothetical protein